MLRNVLTLIVAVCLPLAAGSIGGLVTASSVATWYEGLVKPPWNPPNWVFGPVWTLLYMLMGVASWTVWRAGWEHTAVKQALGLYGVQLLLNVFWSVLFFGLQAPGVALVEILALLGVLVTTTRAFFQVTPVAGILLLPYLSWVVFAALLNAAVWLLNP